MEEVQALPRLKIFLCHSASNKSVVREFYHRLKEIGFEPWLDESGIVAGREWNPEIGKALHTADIVIFCLTKDFIQKALDKKSYIYLEMNTARRLQEEPTKGGNFIIPVRLEHTEIPPELDLERFQRVNFDRDPETGFERLVEALHIKARQLTFLARLPAQEARIVGREREIAELSTRMRQTSEEIRLITLTGPGGIGKSRLSLAVASLLVSDFRDGVFFIELVNFTDPAQVIPAIAHEIIFSQNLTGQNELESLKKYLTGKQLLIVLDNFEQLVGARTNLANLLKAVPGLKIIISSRTKLNLRSELEYPVLPLNLEDLKKIVKRNRLKNTNFEVISQNPAVSLFMKHAQQEDSTIHLNQDNALDIARICLLLEGLPLALEIAAARLRRYEPAEMLERLQAASNINIALGKGKQDLPDRHQSLQLSLDWSYELLEEQERQLFAQLAVFNSGFTLKAVETICELDGEADLEGLDALLDNSLIRRSGPEGQKHYLMLESIRQYASSKLQDMQQLEKLREKHARYYLSEAEKNEKKLAGPEQSRTLDQLEQEHDNLRAALSYGLEGNQGGLELTVRLEVALSRFWLIRNYLGEGRRWFEKALANIPRVLVSVKPELTVKALKAAGTICAVAGDFGAARFYYEQGLPLARELKDKPALLSLLNNMGNIAGEQGDNEAAEKYFLESLELVRELNYQTALGPLLSNLGLIARYKEDYPKARRYLEESLFICRQQSEKGALAATLSTLGDVLLDAGEYVAAQIALSESLIYQQELGDELALAQLLEYFGGLAVARSQLERAVRLFGAASAFRDELEAMPSAVEQSVAKRRLAVTHQVLEQSKWEALWQAGRAMSLEEAVDYAREENFSSDN